MKLFSDPDFRAIFLRFRNNFRVIFGAKMVKKIEEKSIRLLMEFQSSKLGAGKSILEAGEAVWERLGGWVPCNWFRLIPSSSGESGWWSPIRIFEEGGWGWGRRLRKEASKGGCGRMKVLKVWRFGSWRKDALSLDRTRTCASASSGTVADNI